MFDNIIDQKTAVTNLKHDINSGSLPGSMLFHGPACSSKLTTALELARVISCSRKGDWSCSCSSCNMNRLLINPDIIMCGTKSFLREVTAAADVFCRDTSRAAGYLFIRAVRKLTGRFDEVLWQHNDAKIRGIAPTVEKLHELVSEIDPESDSAAMPAEEKKALADKIIKKAEKVLTSSLNFSISIDIVRNLTSWARTSSGYGRKIIILEHVDDMSDGAKNAILKILEEPPEGVLFILTVARKALLLPTIASRLRPYAFIERSNESQKRIMELLFKPAKPEYENLYDYFQAWDELPPGYIKNKARRIIDHITGDTELENDFYTDLENKKNISIFIREMINVLHDILHRKLEKPCVTPWVSAKWLEYLKSVQTGVDVYNQNARLLFESLLYKMKGVL